MKEDLNKKFLEYAKGGTTEPFVEHTSDSESASDDLLCVGDIVVPADPNYPFVSGCGRYSHAFVIAVDPIQMVSEKADMLWCTDVKRERLKVIGTAKPEQLKLCMTRLGT